VKSLEYSLHPSLSSDVYNRISPVWYYLSSAIRSSGRWWSISYQWTVTSSLGASLLLKRGEREGMGGREREREYIVLTWSALNSARVTTKRTDDVYITVQCTRGYANGTTAPTTLVIIRAASRFMAGARSVHASCPFNHALLARTKLSQRGWQWRRKWLNFVLNNCRIWQQ